MFRLLAFLGLQPGRRARGKAIGLVQRACAVTTLHRRGYLNWDSVRFFSLRGLHRSKHCCSCFGVGRCSLLQGRCKSRSRRHWYSGWWSWFVREGARSVTRKHVLCAAAVFLWDNERITHQDVYKCLRRYETRVGRKCFTQTKDTNCSVVTDEVPVVGNHSEQDKGKPLQEDSSNERVPSLHEEAEASPSAESADANPSISPCSGEDGEHALGGFRPAVEVTLEAGDLSIAEESSVTSGCNRPFVSGSTSQPVNNDTVRRLDQTIESTLDSDLGEAKQIQKLECSSEGQEPVPDSTSSVPLAVAPTQHSSEGQEQIPEIASLAPPATPPAQNSSEDQEQVPEITSSGPLVVTPTQHSSEDQEQVPEIPSSVPLAVTPAQSSAEGEKPVLESSSSLPLADACTTAADSAKEPESVVAFEVPIDRDNQAAISEVKESEECVGDPLEGWTPIIQQSNCVVYHKLYKDTGLYQYKVIGSYDDITAKDFIDVQVNNDKRKEWDTYALQLETIDWDSQTGSEVVHWVLKYPYPLANREYVFVRRVWFSDSDDAIVLINRSVDHPSVPTYWRQVRVQTYFSEMVIKPFTFSDQLGFDYELTYFDDPGTYLPSSAVSWVTRSAMPDFMSKIHSAAQRKGQCVNQLQKNMA